MKRSLLVLILVLSVLAGCGQEYTAPPADSETPVASGSITPVLEDDANVTILVSDETDGCGALPAITIDGKVLPFNQAAENPMGGYHHLRLDPGLHEIKSVLGTNPPDALTFEVGNVHVWIGASFWGFPNEGNAPITEFSIFEDAVAGDRHLNVPSQCP